MYREMLYYKYKILISATSSLTQRLISELPDTLLGVQFGYEKTRQRLKRVVYWKGMKNIVRQSIWHCEVCQRSKYKNTHPTGLLQPMPILEQA